MNEQTDIKNKKILLVDDERELLHMLEGILRREGFTRIYSAATCQRAIELFEEIAPQVAILDVMLPDGDGFSLIRRIQEQKKIPVLFLSARGEDEDRLLGLGLGADDYLVKPFLPRELILRLTAILKRTYGTIQENKIPAFELGNATIDLTQGIIEKGGHSYPLTAKEFAILLTLWENKNRIVTSDSLCEAVWNDGSYGYENTLMVHIRRIRKKLEDDPSQPQYLLTVRGLGYKLQITQRGAQI